MKRGPLRVDVIDEATLIELKYYYPTLCGGTEQKEAGIFVTI